MSFPLGDLASGRGWEGRVIRGRALMAGDEVGLPGRAIILLWVGVGLPL